MSITLNKFLKNDGYCSVKLVFLETKHYLVEAKVNGVKGKFILDTGASNSCICTSLEDKFKVISKESKEKASSANSEMTHTMISKSNMIQIDKWEDKINIVMVGHYHQQKIINHEESSLIFLGDWLGKYTVTTLNKDKIWQGNWKEFIELA